MRIISRTVPGSLRLARVPELSRQARQRLKWMEYYQQNEGNARLTCRHFDISPQTFYRWKRRYDPCNLKSLEDPPRGYPGVSNTSVSPPGALSWPRPVLRLREQYPRWGKDKLVMLLRREGFRCATSMVGRILCRLKARGVLREPIGNGISARRRRTSRPYGIRKPKDYQIKKPGDLVQLDTLDVRPLPGVVLKHFTARDVICRWDVVDVYTRATAATACQFLDALQQRMPFPIRAIQVDGGAEFEAQFETEYQRRSIHLFILPPRSPELNGCVERAQRTHTEEFYEVTDSSFDIAESRTGLLGWEQVYNTVRPHQALGYLSPLEFLKQWKENQKKKEALCH